ncbi:LacI family DNA-binding transcriptional regulator [Phycisphaera mikurensis]|uniref:Putative LacI family transcriptional regulator n=1 Tax=Phycisphaera mikurensis (strain NBRC 102666 / KCTC 22515 / FYK2301M01) TaxID=1142394 RepID=I0II04_PHYMF|nr:LacI family DNA-binding transcriptional regulator [Phycisphaera mikurensis]MBB6442544.1 DNA-binding LacI/PurR family transcriptional regulator [Phycisphaera mikurensis]BAM04892.1 putative LacI family transcriptional regulator [Phycisphaera mikurensis NBRC 102666]
MSTRSPTAAEVAARAGVSRMTVYRVMKEDPRVSSSTATSVQRAIRDLNYLPPGQRNAEADAAGAGGRHGRLAFLIPDADVAALRTALTGRLLHGIDAVLTPRSLELSLTRLPAPGQLPGLITRRKVDGVIVRSSHRDEFPAERIERVPCVWLMESRRPAPPGDVVHTDDVEIGRLAAEAFCRRGRRHVAILNENAEHTSYNERVRGLQVSLSGGPVATEPVDAAGLSGSTRQAAACIDRLLDRHPGLDGFFLPGTVPFVSLLHQALAARGRDLGGVTIVSASYDADLNASLRPRPVHIDARPEQLGEAAAELLLWRLSHPAAARRRVTVVPAVIEPEND